MSYVLNHATKLKVVDPNWISVVLRENLTQTLPANSLWNQIPANSLKCETLVLSRSLEPVHNQFDEFLGELLYAVDQLRLKIPTGCLVTLRLPNGQQWSSPVDLYTIKYVCRTFPELKSVRLYQCCMTYPNHVDALITALQSLRQLEDLSLKCGWDAPEIHQFVVKFPHLRSLTLGHDLSLDPETVALIAAMPELTAADLPRQCIDDSIELFTSGRGPGKFPKLLWLTVLGTLDVDGILDDYDQDDHIKKMTYTLRTLFRKRRGGLCRPELDFRFEKPCEYRAP